MIKTENVEELKLEIIRLKKELKKKKKYGLTWESKKEELVEYCKQKLPVLIEDKSKELYFDENLQTNIIIEGDNYHALSVLNYTHEKKVDVIYIDPPYNTGARDWKYNNNYVDINDNYRHSKWICMMYTRLKLAKKLLSKNGVLICAIDDNEFATLSLLLDEVFPNKIRNTVVIMNNPHGVSRSGFSRCHEYALFVLNAGQVVNKKPAPIDNRTINLRRSGNNSLREDSPTMFYPIYVNKSNLQIEGVGDVPNKNYHPKKQFSVKNGKFEIWPIDSKGIEKNWYYSKKRVEAYGKNELICKIVKENPHIYFKHSNNSEQTYKTVWTGSEYDAGAYGATLVKKLTNNNFPFPKSIYTVFDCIKAVMKSKDAIILDFFAGSGTTGHAISLLNKEDNGKRQFILCTNNENNIADKVCLKRIKAVINGHKDFKDLTGIKSNLKYYKTSFIDAKITDSNKKALTIKATEMLCIKENTYIEVNTKSKHFRLFKKNNKYTGIIYDYLEIDMFKKFIKHIDGIFTVYIFSLDDECFYEEFSDLRQKVKLSPIPEAILRIYRRIFI